MKESDLLAEFQLRLNGHKLVIFRELVRRYYSEEPRVKLNDLENHLNLYGLRDKVHDLRKEFGRFCQDKGFPEGQVTTTYVAISLSNHRDVRESRLFDNFWKAHREVSPAVSFSYTESLMFRERDMRALIRFLDVNGHEADEEGNTRGFLKRRTDGQYVLRILTPGTKTEALDELDENPAEREIWAKQKGKTRLVTYRLFPIRGYVSAGETEFLLQISHAISPWAKARFAPSHREQAFDIPSDATLIALGNARTHVTIREALGWSRHALRYPDRPIYSFHDFPFRVDKNGIVKVRSNRGTTTIEYQKKDFSDRDDGCFSIYGLVSRMKAPGSSKPMTFIIGNHSATFSAISRFLQHEPGLKELLARLKAPNINEFPAEFQVLFEAVIRRNDEGLVDAGLPFIVDVSVAQRSSVTGS